MADKVINKMDGFERNAHAVATFFTDIVLGGMAMLWLMGSRLGEGLIYIKPEVQAIGALVFVFTLCVRAYIAVKDARARSKRREEDK